jgi:geranylgeranyl reductase family protein
MAKDKRVAIVGGGPAGATCAYLLAQNGLNPLLFEAQPNREKPCGGGLTQRAVQALSFADELEPLCHDVDLFEVIAPNGNRTCVPLAPPIRIVARTAFDSMLRGKAKAAGAHAINERARDISRQKDSGWRVNGRSVDIVVGAGGINDPIARHRGCALASVEKAQSIGWYIPGRFEPRIICRFFKRTYGYAWWFPRRDHASLGIELEPGPFDKGAALRRLHQFVNEDLVGIDIDRGRRFSWALPLQRPAAFLRHRYCGKDWLLAGDAAGLVDPLTGEGLSYAILSGTLAAKAIIQDALESYPHWLYQDILTEITIAGRFVAPFYYTENLNHLVAFLSHSRAARKILGDVAHGRQPYRTLKRRVYGELGGILRETVAGIIAAPWKKCGRYH